MCKTVKKLMPCAPWYIGELECWFSDMAKKGLILDEFDWISAKFYKEEPAELRFRIDIIQNPDKAQEQIDLYAESGWGFAAKYGEYYVYASYTENEDPELHTDPAEQAFTIKKYIRKSTIYFLLSQVVLLPVIIFIVPLHFKQFAEGNYIGLWYWVLPIVAGVACIKELVSLRIIKRRLSDGQSINHSAPWKKKRRRRIASVCLIVLSYIAIIVLQFVLPLN